MVRWAKTAGQKEKEKGGPKKPKKELGVGMDIAQVALPILASVVGTPLMGIAVSALLEGAESKLEGGSWKEAVTKGLVSGGMGAVTGGAGSAIAGEVGKKAGTEAVKAVTKKGVDQVAGGLTKEAAKGFGVNITGDVAKNLVTKNPLAQQAMADTMGKAIAPGVLKGAAGGFGVNLSPGVANAAAASNPGMQAATRAAGDASFGATAANAFGGQGGEAAAKTRFLEHITELGTMGAETYQAAQAEGAAKRGHGEAINAQMQARLQGVMDGERHPRQKPRYSGYGGY